MLERAPDEARIMVEEPLGPAAPATALADFDEVVRSLPLTSHQGHGGARRRVGGRCLGRCTRSVGCRRHAARPDICEANNAAHDPRARSCMRWIFNLIVNSPR
jgi:hypothetical protein